ncbi:MAG: type VI secretion system baseplate subunit TssG [Planctomyces sp.]|nr:type VI secretion system baseplate subunit TssG [Planctomyces sp.]
MDGKNRQSPPDLICQLLRHAEEFEFFQAVHLLESCAREDIIAARADSRSESRGNSADAEALQRNTAERRRTALQRSVALRALGSAPNPRSEPIRFRAQPSRSFPPGDVTSIVPAKPETQGSSAEIDEVRYPVEVTVPFMGLTGPNGVLPDHYTTLLIERSHQKNKDHSLREFFDLFNHRAITLFYLAWRKHRICEEYLRMCQDGRAGEDRFTSAMLSITGFGLRRLRGQHNFSDEVFLYYGGLFANQRRTSIGLQQMLSDFLGLRVSLEEFRGRWLYLPAEVQSSFPSRSQPSGMNLGLGESVVAGSRAWDRQSSFRVTIGPLSRAMFDRLLPGTRELKAVEQLIRTYTGIEFDFEIQLILRASDIPACQLTSGATDTGGGQCRPSLGWTTWLGKAMIPVDSGDAVFRFSGIPSGM